MSQTPQQPPSTSEGLLHRLGHSGDAEAWELFVRVYGPAIHRHAVSCGLDHADALDVTQEVLLQVSQQIALFEYDRSRGRFRDWLRRIAHRRCLDLLRARRRRRERETRAAVDWDAGKLVAEWDQAVLEELTRLAMAKAKGQVEPKTWLAFEATWMRQRPPAEVAVELGMDVSQVYLAKSRVLARIRREVLLLADGDPPLPSMPVKESPPTGETFHENPKSAE